MSDTEAPAAPSISDDLKSVGDKIAGLTLKEAVDWGFVKEVVPQDRLVARAVDYAAEIASMAPDSVIITRLAAREAWETGISRATMRGQELWAENMLKSKNASEGLAAYREKRDPNWFPSHI